MAHDVTAAVTAALVECRLATTLAAEAQAAAGRAATMLSTALEGRFEPSVAAAPAADSKPHDPTRPTCIPVARGAPPPSPKP